MQEHQVFEELELANSEISGACRLHTLTSSDTNTNMCLADHVTVIGSVTDGEHALVWEAESHECDDIALLLRADTAANHDIHVISGLKKKLK